MSVASSRTALEFSRYIKLESEWKDEAWILKQELRNHYTEYYKPNFKTTNPGHNIASFSLVYREMAKQKLVQHKNENGILCVKVRAGKPSVAQNILSSSRQRSPSESGDAPRNRRRRTRTKARAVDQYITMGRGDPVEVSYDRNVEGLGDDAGLPFGINRKGIKGFECTLCKVSPNSQTTLESHLKGNKHRVRILSNAFKDKNALFICNSCVEVKSDYDFEGRSIRLDDLLPNTKRTVTITIRNISPDQDVTLMRYKMIKKNRVFTFDDSRKVHEQRGSVKIQPGKTYEVLLTVTPKHINHYHGCVAFVFENKEEGKIIQIIRYLSAICTTPAVKDFGPTAPFRKPPRVTLSRPRGTIEDGYRPDSDSQSQLEREEPLRPYPIANWMRRLVNMGLKPTEQLGAEEMNQLKDIKTLLQTDLDRASHKRLFDLLLLLEEIQMEVDIRKYDMEDVTMDHYGKNTRLLTLKVPGLSENRPSVLRGDHLFVKLKEDDDIEYKGYVHSIELEVVHLGFGQKLMNKFIKGMKFDVRFTFNRLTMRLMHRAVELAEEHSLDQILFPTPDVIGKLGTIVPVDAKLILNDRKLEQNEEQKRAVQHIVAGTSRPAPYILFGPPGTGKTVTMVESIKQVLRCIPKSRVLACAPSNSAADLMCQRILGHWPKKEVFRMNALSRVWSDIPEDIKDCCNWRGDGFYYPAKADFEQYRVVVTTLMTAGRIASANFPSGYFSHVFVDESGHSTEPETLIALAGILESDIHSPDGGQVVFAGDPKQLGPVLRSPVSIKHGLSQSILERLMEKCEAYSRDDNNTPPYDPTRITKLVRNYRSHPAILEQPNKMFYHGELQVCADQMERESLCRWEELPKKGFPILFHGVVGKDEREEKSPSFFNAEECVTVMDYVDKLLNGRGMMKLKPKQIGIISPYRKQVQKLRGAIRKKKKPELLDLKVGSVEEFQGQERMVIIISTVRSSDEFLPYDKKFNLGFLKNPKRFNVAVTRAKALLIVVGNPYLLRMDPNWNQLLQYVINNGGYTGCDMMQEDDEDRDIIERMAAVKLDTVDEPDISAVTAQEDPEWRGEN